MSVEELGKCGNAYRSHPQNLTIREREPFLTVFWHLLGVGEVAFPLLLTPQVAEVSISWQ